MSREEVSPKYKIASTIEQIGSLQKSLMDTLTPYLDELDESKKSDSLNFFETYIDHLKSADSEYNSTCLRGIRKPSDECIKHIQSANIMHATLGNMFPFLKGNSDFIALSTISDTIREKNGNLGVSIDSEFVK